MTRIGDLARFPSWPEGETVSWNDFAAAHAARAHHARVLADRVLEGQPMPRLAGWRCALPSLAQVRPPLGAMAATLSPASGTDQRRSVHLHLRALSASGSVEDTPRHRLAWALERADTLGWRVDTNQRAAWNEGWAPDPKDGDAATCWAGWLGGAWSMRATFEALFLDRAVRAFRAVAHARNLPDHATRTAVDGLKESLFYRLLSPDDDGVPGWAELAARVLETADQGPMTPLIATLDDRQRRVGAVCAVSRGSWRATAATVLKGPTRLERAQQLERGLDDPEPWADAHILRRLVRAWNAGRVDSDHAIVAQGRGRLRARLRRLASARPGTLAQAVLDLDALYARTDYAVARFCWAWAWEELARDFAFDLGRQLSAPCVQNDELTRVDGDRLAALNTWVLLVALRGRLGHLRRWAATGSTGDRDTTWGRLLKECLPADLREDRYVTLRLALEEHLGELLLGHVPTLRAIAGLPAGRALRRQAEAVLQPVWHGAVPLPKSGFPSMVRSAQDAVDQLTQDTP